MNNYEQCLHYLYSALPMYQNIGNKAYKKDLSNIIQLCNALGNPQSSFKSIHIAGTNGKGNIAHALKSVLYANNIKTGLYTSPHLIDFRERIRIDGKMISKNFVVDFVKQIEGLIEEIKPSFFEITVAMAFVAFREYKVQWAIIETGLGGRLDSTNIITPKLSIISNISLEHTDMLGNTLEQIAFEKAGIIKKNVPVIIGETTSETKPVFLEKAMSSNAPIYFTETDFNEKPFPSDLEASYQQRNLKIVQHSLKILSSELNLNEEKTILGYKNIKKYSGYKGRWDVLSKKPLIILDTAHNYAGIQNALKELDAYHFKKLMVIMGVVKGKETQDIWKLFPKDTEFVLTKPSIERARDENDLAQEAATFGISSTSESTVEKAYYNSIKRLNDDKCLLILGSIFLIADFYSFYESKKTS